MVRVGRWAAGVVAQAQIPESVGVLLVSLWKKVLLSLLDKRGDGGNRRYRGRQAGEVGSWGGKRWPTQMNLEELALTMYQVAGKE